MPKCECLLPDIVIVFINCHVMAAKCGDWGVIVLLVGKKARSMYVHYYSVIIPSSIIEADLKKSKIGGSLI